jgi:hypothetical protein
LPANEQNGIPSPEPPAPIRLTVPDPFSSTPGARLYRTGDLARYLLDGLLDFLGRIDHRVKVCGFRIELGEIEARLAQHPQVSECTILAQNFAHSDDAFADDNVSSLISCRKMNKVAFPQKSYANIYKHSCQLP